MTTIGIDDLEIATTHHVLDLADLAAARDVAPAKYLKGLGQAGMSVPAPDEDTVTMGAAAAQALLARHGSEDVRALLFATESGVDQSKSAGLYVHGLLDLPPQMRVVEFKQACYGGTAALQTALGMIAREPDAKVLVISSDVAKYALPSSGEPTQGAAAVAMLISADPALVEIEPVTGVSTREVDDFWRPNDSTTAVVDGALSISAYENSITGSWDDYSARGGHGIEQIDRFVHHQPFTKMARKAHARLAKHTGAELADDMIESGLLYNRELGNSYTASLYIALASLLHQEPDLDGKRIGFFSYGSGSIGEFFTGVVRPGYAQHLRPETVRAALADRTPVDVETYSALHSAHLPSGTDAETERVTTAPFRFAGIRGRARVYERTAAHGD